MLDKTVHVTSFSHSYRLSKEVSSEDSYETVDWLELKHAVEEKVCLPCKFSLLIIRYRQIAQHMSCSRGLLQTVNTADMIKSYRDFGEDVQTRVTIRLTNCRRHVGSSSEVAGYYRARVSRYANSDSTFQLIRVVISKDVGENPGPTLKKPKCQQCIRTIARNHRIITCSSCDSTYHIKCGGVTPKQHKTITTSDQTWNCLHCAQLTATLSNNALTELPFSHTTDESFSSLFGGNHQDSIGNLTVELAINADDLYNITNELNVAPKDTRVGHLNICSFRNKIDGIRLIQNICRFDILGICETHLNSKDADRDIHIDSLEFLRLDRKERKGGGCVLYYADYLNVTHLAWIQAKFPTTNVLFSVIYRSELYLPNFFTNLQDVMEKAWMKTDNIVLLRDLNCNLLGVNECSLSSDLQTKTRNLLHIFDVFNIQNVIKEATRITPSTEILIDVISTNKPELVRRTGVSPLGITDHTLVYTTLKVKTKKTAAHSHCSQEVQTI